MAARPRDEGAKSGQGWDDASIPELPHPGKTTKDDQGLRSPLGLQRPSSLRNQPRAPEPVIPHEPTKGSKPVRPPEPIKSLEPIMSPEATRPSEPTKGSGVGQDDGALG
uniref:Uncharacterized protein n=1 Tax=Oryza barthii TaxID=65489 RepID=A0A0D3G5K2_9ORYZ